MRHTLQVSFRLGPLARCALHAGMWMSEIAASWRMNGGLTRTSILIFGQIVVFSGPSSFVYFPALPDTSDQWEERTLPHVEPGSSTVMFPWYTRVRTYKYMKYFEYSIIWWLTMICGYGVEYTCLYWTVSAAKWKETKPSGKHSLTTDSRPEQRKHPKSSPTQDEFQVKDHYCILTLGIGWRNVLFPQKCLLLTKQHFC